MYSFVIIILLPKECEFNTNRFYAQRRDNNRRKSIDRESASTARACSTALWWRRSNEHDDNDDNDDNNDDKDSVVVNKVNCEVDSSDDDTAKRRDVSCWVDDNKSARLSRSRYGARERGPRARATTATTDATIAATIAATQAKYDECHGGDDDGDNDDDNEQYGGNKRADQYYGDGFSGGSNRGNDIDFNEINFEILSSIKNVCLLDAS